MNHLIRVKILAGALLLASTHYPAWGEEPLSTAPVVTPLLESSETILHQPIAYPTGTAKIAASIVTIPPGAETGWHIHPVPLFGYVLEGELAVDYGGDEGFHIYRQGDSLLEAIDWPHNGMNRTHAPVRILVVTMGAEGAPNAIVEPR